MRSAIQAFRWAGSGRCRVWISRNRVPPNPGRSSGRFDWDEAFRNNVNPSSAAYRALSTSSVLCLSSSSNWSWMMLRLRVRSSIWMLTRFSSEGVSSSANFVLMLVLRPSNWVCCSQPRTVCATRSRSTSSCVDASRNCLRKPSTSFRSGSTSASTVTETSAVAESTSPSRSSKSP